MHIYTVAPIVYIHIHTYTYMYIHIHAYTYIYMHIHTYTYIYLYTVAYTAAVIVKKHTHTRVYNSRTQADAVVHLIELQSASTR